MPRKKEQTFEENLAQLEQIVALLENGDASLDDIMKNYSAGMELSKKCLDALTKASKEMDVPIEQHGGAVTESELRIEGDQG